MAADAIVQKIPLGQPILQDHHSENVIDAIAIRNEYTSYTSRAQAIKDALLQDNALRLPHYRVATENGETIYITQLTESWSTKSLKQPEQSLTVKGDRVFMASNFYQKSR